MKKQLLKLTLLTFVFLCASSVQAQADLLWTKAGWYKLGARGTSPALFMTINTSSGALEWAEELPNDAPTQVWAIQDHRTQAGAGFVEIYATIPGVGNFTMTTSSVEADGKNLTISVKAGDPQEVEVLGGDLSGLDQFQRRKAKVDANGDADSGGANPAAGNNALFIKVPWDGGSRYGIVPAAAGDPVQFDGGGIDVLDYHLVEEILSVNTFEANAFLISNPVNNQLTIKGATSKIQELSLFSVLGKRVLTKSIKETSGDVELNVSSLSKGLYIVEITGVNGEIFTRKIIKQ